MSIKIPPINAIPSPAAGASKESSSKTDFEGLLRSAIERPAPPSPAELAAAMRLRLLHQALDLGEDEPGGFSSAPPFSLIFDSLPNLSSSGRVVSRQTFDHPSPVAVVTDPPDQPSPAPPSAKSPPPLANIVERAAERYRVAPEVIRAVIRAESGFDARAVSPAGAQGLMQLMPGTAHELGVTDPFDPEQNVMAGTRYLKQMLTRYGGNLEKALAAYNWGPGNVDRSDGHLPGETRRYIARIKGFLARG